MPTEPTGRRARNRVARHQQLMGAATEIIAEAGVDGLTMQSVAERVDCAVGTIYTYFSSKSALLAELQIEAIRTLTSSAERSRAVWEDEIAEAQLDDAVAALARLVGMAKLFVAAPELHPREFELLQIHLATSRRRVGPDDTLSVVPHALELLAQMSSLVEAAVATGVIEGPGDDDDAAEVLLSRTLRWVGGLNGALLLSNVTSDPAWLSEEELDGPRLATMLSQDLLRAWGAPPRTLRSAVEFVEDLAVRDRLMRPGGEVDTGSAISLDD